MTQDFGPWKPTALALLIAVLITMPAAAQPCANLRTGEAIECPDSRHWGASVLAGAVQPVTPGEMTESTTQPFARVSVWAQITRWDQGPRLDVALTLSGQDSLSLADPGTVKALEGSVSLVQPLGPALWFSVYGELGGAALVGSEATPAFGGLGAQFESDDRRARLRVGYSRDERLTGSWEHAVSVSGHVELVDARGVALVLGGDWLRQAVTVSTRSGPKPSRSRVRVWVAAGWGS